MESFCRFLNIFHYGHLLHCDGILPRPTKASTLSVQLPVCRFLLGSSQRHPYRLELVCPVHTHTLLYLVPHRSSSRRFSGKLSHRRWGYGRRLQKRCSCWPTRQTWSCNSFVQSWIVSGQRSPPTPSLSSRPAWEIEGHSQITPDFSAKLLLGWDSIIRLWPGTDWATKILLLPREEHHQVHDVSVYLIAILFKLWLVRI